MIASKKDEQASTQPSTGLGQQSVIFGWSMWSCGRDSEVDLPHPEKGKGRNEARERKEQGRVRDTRLNHDGVQPKQPAHSLSDLKKKLPPPLNAASSFIQLGMSEILRTGPVSLSPQRRVCVSR